MTARRVWVREITSASCCGFGRFAGQGRAGVGRRVSSNPLQRLAYVIHVPLTDHRPCTGPLTHTPALPPLRARTPSVLLVLCVYTYTPAALGAPSRLLCQAPARGPDHNMSAIPISSALPASTTFFSPSSRHSTANTPHTVIDIAISPRAQLYSQLHHFTITKLTKNASPSPEDSHHRWQGASRKGPS